MSFRISLVLAAVCGAAVTHNNSPAVACTGAKLVAKDGSVVVGRTLEFGQPLDSSIILVPAGRKYTGTTPDGKPGLTWQVKYPFTGMNFLDQPHVIDGLNAKGLAVGLFYFPGYADYQKFDPAESDSSLAPWEFGTWILSNFATTDELKKGLANVRVVPTVFSKWGFVPPAHFGVTDAKGNSIVIEFVDGTVHVYDNPIGVLTNSPTFDWHLTNLRNYINLSPINVAPERIGGLTLAQFGQGSGLRGLPGDFTPPSRFVRAAILSSSAAQGDGGEETVGQLFHVLNQFDIPLGTVRTVDKNGRVDFERTEWTAVSDTAARRYYFRTFGNSRTHVIDLTAADFSSDQILTIPFHTGPEIEDMTPGK